MIRKDYAGAAEVAEVVESAELHKQFAWKLVGSAQLDSHNQADEQVGERLALSDHKHSSEAKGSPAAGAGLKPVAACKPSTAVMAE